MNGTPTISTPSTTSKYTPGTMISVGSHKVEIIDYIAEGGFAQIYKVRFLEYLNEFDNNDLIDNYSNENGINTQNKYADNIIKLNIGDIACLKRVIVQDENGLKELRNEVNVMQKLKGCSNIIQIFDSAATHIHDKKTGYEILVLMELCPNKSLLDYMNQRLSTKLNEGEILKIMYDITLALAHMHYLSTPLIHRDIKIENVLVDAQNNFKLCDFGSVSRCFPIVTSHHDIAVLSQDIYVHTTPQYRSPEMIDLYRYLPIDEKSDIWALGVFLYKLLFFTTPFERTGQFAILHSKYDLPMNNYSSKLINLIIIMLSENPNLRPNIYQVLYEICKLTKTNMPIPDKYNLGPYNFEKYSVFQNNLTNVQLTMFNLQNKKISNNGILSSFDINTIDNLFMTSFNIAPQIPTTSSPTNKINAQSNANALSKKENDNIGELQNMPILVSETPVNDEKSKTVKPNKNLSSRMSPTKNEDNTHTSEHYYPTVNELNTYLDSQHEIQKERDIAQQAQTQMPAQNQNQDLNLPEASLHNLKQHKSNNPFPMINPADHSMSFKTDYDMLTRMKLQQQQQQNVAAPDYSMQGQVVQERNTNPYKIQGPNNTILQQSPPQFSYMSQQANVSSNPYRPVQGSFAQSPQPMSPVMATQSPQMSPTIPMIRVSSSLQDNNIENNYRNTNNSNAKEPGSSHNSPPLVPPHPKQRPITRENTATENYEHPKPPPIPRHPVKHQELEESLIDLSSPERGSKRMSSKDKYCDGKNDNNTNDVGGKNVMVKKNVDSKRSVSMNDDHRRLINPQTSESIDFDLEGAKRKSLDLKLQKLSVKENQKHLKHRGGFTNNDNDGHDGGKNRYLDTLKHPEQNTGGSVIANIGLRNESMLEIREDAHRARKSLDLERLNNDALLADMNKRRSIFSRFRSEK